MPVETTAPGDPVLTPLLERGAVTLVGGAADAERLKSLLDWLAGMAEDGAWWRCLEWTDRVALEAGPPALPENLLRLVWGRWFGAAGDLEAWRDGEVFRWRFAGDGEVRPTLQQGDTDAFDVARGGDAELRLRAVERKAMLWPRDDARVATASPKALRLLAPRPAPVWVRYREYLDHGAAAAVRYVAVEDPAGKPWNPGRDEMPSGTVNSQ
jgi:hypothetical protein